MHKPQTYQITITGIVQGIGFRPFIYNLANKLHHKGYVSNGLDGVKIIFNADEKSALDFMEKIINEAPKKAKISEKNIQKVKKQVFNNFEIKESECYGKSILTLTPDYAICKECLAELYNPQNRRYKYPFITCTNCGPRYSIIKKLPYDRHNTTMAVFEICNHCQNEYQNSADRRFHSQSNSCPKCPIKLVVYDNQHKIISENQTEIVDIVCHYLKQQKILAIKGIGGYIIICDATNNETVQQLRARKHRPEKPFAVMFADLQSLDKYTYFSEREKDEIESDIAPIVLLKQKKHTNLAPSINPNLCKIGAILPYSPLFHLICRQFSKPIIATSGNISGNPIIYDDQKALYDFIEIADFIVTNNRQILMPQDDSVVQFSQYHQQKIILRRSRGFDLDFPIKNSLGQNKIAFGASVKGGFAIKHDEKTFVSQYLGNLESYETQENFKNVLEHYTDIFETKNTTQNILCDAHPAYFSSLLAENLSESTRILLQKVQHHEAHFLAILADNQLFESNEPILGIIWDGTGLGADGHIWGGEFFKYEPNSFNKKIDNRIHFEYFDAILGDKMALEPRIAAFCLTNCIKAFEDFTKNKFTTQEWFLYQKIIKKNLLKTSSVGRLFDAVASILGLIDSQTYEGQAAILLEQCAEKYFDVCNYDFFESYLPENSVTENIPTQVIITGILIDIKQKKSIEFIAAKFHISLVSSIKMVANNLKINKLSFSGGVFQNALLVDLIIHHLGRKYQLYFHKNFSPNDENIAIGQLHYSKLF